MKSKNIKENNYNSKILAHCFYKKIFLFFYMGNCQTEGGK